jgi:uncharacterized YceG family protein
MAERTPEERERDRLEREARRAARQGDRAPSAPVAASAAPPAGPTPTKPSPEAPPPATGRQWRRAAGEPDPDPPLVRRVASGAPREAVHGDDQPLPQPAPVPAPTRRIPPPPPVPFDDNDAEQAIGTKRVPAGNRVGRPHLPHRRPAAPEAATTGPGRRRPVLRRVLPLLALALAAAVIWFGFSLFQPFTGGGSGTLYVQIPRGASASQIGDLLERRGVISSSFFFDLRARLEGKRDKLKAGRFRLKDGMSYAAALDALTHNPPAPRIVTLTIPEGRSRSEIAPLARQVGLTGDYVAASRSSKELDPREFGAPKGATLEGFLFPATYQLRPGASVGRLVREQLAAFRQNIASVDLRHARHKNLSAYDVVVIASMIEREAAVAKDRPLIAAVIYNRLADGMPLGIDATLRYALHNWTRPLKVSELASNSPYNTGKHTGLPPTPIGNPGLASIKAAADPARVGYLFYVVKPCGNGAHAFSSTDAQFQRDVAAYNAKRAQLGGKSPVTCK